MEPSISTTHESALTRLNGQDIAEGLEPVPLPISGLSVGELENLCCFEKYVTDSILPDGTPLSSAGPHLANELEDGVSDEEDDPGCGCDITAEGIWSCTRGDGDSCECVAEFGNFYTTPSQPGSSTQTLNLDALPDRWPLVECSSECPCTQTCGNRLTQTGVHAPVTIRPVPQAGLGLFYTPPDLDTLPTGRFISLYAGEYLNSAEARQRWATRPDNPSIGTGNYILSLRLPDLTLHIDPRRIGNVGRFLNHSCEPNCIIQVVRWGRGSWPRAAIFTKRDVAPQEELTFDYGNASGAGGSEADEKVEGSNSVAEVEGESARTRCFCGSAKCRGWMPYDETL